MDLKHKILFTLVQNKVFNAVLIYKNFETRLTPKVLKEVKKFTKVGLHQNYILHSWVLYNTEVYSKLPPPQNFTVPTQSSQKNVYTKEDISMLNESLCDFKSRARDEGSKRKVPGTEGSKDLKNDSVHTQIKFLYQDIEIFSDTCIYDISSIESKGVYFKKAKQIEDVLRSSKIEGSEGSVTILYKRIYTIGYLTKKLLTLHNHIPKTLTEKVNSLGTKDHDYMLTSEEIEAFRNHFKSVLSDFDTKFATYDFQWNNPAHQMFIIHFFLQDEFFGSYGEFTTSDNKTIMEYEKRSIQLLDIMRK
jgi:hypothetical protein